MLTRVSAAACAALLLGGCASVRAPSPLTGLAIGAGLREPRFASPGAAGEPAAWTANVTFHEFASFCHATGERLPAACSLGFSLRNPVVEDGRTRLDAAGAWASAPAAGDRSACVPWPAIVGALDDLASAIPRRVWTTALVQDGRRLEIEGLSADADDLTAFAAALSATSHLDEVRILSTKDVASTERTLLGFRLSARFRE